ncbi:phage replication initiation protein, NGO0469 family [Gaopeijia maritima]|uniref:phage replication initiation protein, NGO0469 family n=1 Tax=Gaopeijia maritima TaxID=3119007 RepID=UPI00328A722A
MAEEQPLIATEGKALNIPPHPDGQFAATCIDVIDIGMVERTYRGKRRAQHRIIIRFFCGEHFRDDEGQLRPLWVDAWFTLSLSQKSALRPFLEAWRGKRFNAEELQGFNVRTLVGVDAYLQLSHNATPSKTYCNIDSVMRLPKELQAPGVPEGYVRVELRPDHDEEDFEEAPF